MIGAGTNLNKDGKISVERGDISVLKDEKDWLQDVVGKEDIPGEEAIICKGLELEKKSFSLKNDRKTSWHITYGEVWAIDI